MCLLQEGPLQDLLCRDTRLHPRWCQLLPFEIGPSRYAPFAEILVNWVGLGIGVKYGDELVDHSLVILGPGNVALEGLAQIAVAGAGLRRQKASEQGTLSPSSTST